MSADTAAALAAGLAAFSALVALAVAGLLARRVRELRRLVEQLRAEAVPLVHQARVVVDQAATEMERVGDVLGSAEAVTATVDSASRLAYRAFANPVVGVLAFASGLAGGLRRLFGRAPRPAADSARSGDGVRGGGETRPASARRHRRRRKVAERRWS
jgi:hypothetical protein